MLNGVSSSMKNSFRGSNYARIEGGHFDGDFSFAVVTGNKVLEDTSQVETSMDTTFDGHGGTEASVYFQDHLFENLKHTAGSCCLVGVVCTRKSSVANLGDSQVVKVYTTWSNFVYSQQLHSEHNASKAEVKEEVRSEDISQGVSRIKDSSQVSRSIGDAWLKSPAFALSSSFPQFNLHEHIRRPVQAQVLLRNDQIVIFVFNGSWENSKSKEAVHIVLNSPQVFGKSLATQSANTTTSSSSSGSSVSSGPTSLLGGIFKVKSPRQLSDVSDDEQIEMPPSLDTEATSVTKVKVIPIYEFGPGITKTKKGEITLYSCKGYFSFAQELQGECPFLDDGEHVLPHVLNPWAPRYPRAEYFSAQRNGMKLDPLLLSWSSFASRLDYVLVFRAQVHEIPLLVFRGENIIWNLRVVASAVETSKKMFRAIHFYSMAYMRREPGDPDRMPLIAWQGGLISFSDRQGVELDIPGDYSSSSSSEFESDSSIGEEGEVVNQVVDTTMAVDKIEDDKSEHDKDEEGDDGDDAEWKAFLSRIHSINVRLRI